MNGHMQHLSNLGKDKTSSNKKCKLTVKTNHGQISYNTRSRRDPNAVITNRDPTTQEETRPVPGHDSNSSKRGKRNSFYDNRINDENCPSLTLML